MDNDLRQYLDEKFAKIDGQFAKIDEKFTKIDGQFTKIDENFARIDKRFEEFDRKFADIDSRFEALETRLNQRIENVETALLTEFHKWASPAEARARTHAAATPRDRP